MTHLRTKDLPALERPDEKFEKYGPEVLSDAELLAIIIRSGSYEERSVEVAQRVLNASCECDGLGGLLYLKRSELQRIKGIGKVKAMQLLSITEIYKRLLKTSRTAKRILNTPRDIAGYYMPDMQYLRTEKCIAVYFDMKCRIIGEEVISAGTVNSSVISPREVFIFALEHNAVSVVLLHNHPSGDPTPSREDCNMTLKFKEAGNILDIHLLDHIVIGDGKYFSFLEKELL